MFTIGPNTANVNSFSDEFIALDSNGPIRVYLHNIKWSFGSSQFQLVWFQFWV